MTTDLYIGVDLGGTNVRVGAVTSNAQLLTYKDTLIQAAQGPKAGLDKISDLIQAVCAEAGAKPRAIGIGATGPIDRERGAIQNPYTLPTWENVDILSPLSEKFDVPVTLENDADAAALGESWAGVGRGLERLFMATFGTGVGTAFILNGEIYRGMRGVHPEGGHIILDPSGPECYCGAHGCWESLASGTAIGAYARDLANRNLTLMTELAGGDPEAITGGIVAKAARKGDPLALQVMDRAATYIGLGFVNMIALFVPDIIVFTGGVMRSFDLMEDKVRTIISHHNVMVPSTDVLLRPAALGQQAGMIGAARAAMKLLN